MFCVDNLEVSIPKGEATNQILSKLTGLSGRGFNPQRGGYKFLVMYDAQEGADCFNPQRGGYK
ncbi:hypothetical protein B0S93_0916 [Caldicellulosiruptor bescii]|nr:hypothetical protein B0S93_0913 [Caldicellulosiruptor bescii]PFH17116.1 hypothetical protein B0S93_0916 [Caldicellulosiruptor bescii]PFH26303.1 hypothetical protein B0S92_2881 [Caldicellulosiruptor bescii]